MFTCRVNTSVLQTVLFLFLTQAITLYSACLHTVLLCDINSPISDQCRTDMENMRKLSHLLVKECDLRLEEKVFTSGLDTEEEIRSYIQHLHVEKGDLGIFYFSGHGYHHLSQRSIWPCLVLSPLHQNALDFQEVIRLFEGHSLRFFLGLVDCCNTIRREMNSQYPFGMYSKHFHPFPEGTFRRNLFSLFLSKPSSIKGMSSQMGQASFSSCRGGVMSCVLFDRLYDQMGKKELSSWEDLLLGTKLIVEQITEGKQVPVFIIGNQFI